MDALNAADRSLKKRGCAIMVLFIATTSIPGYKSAIFCIPAEQVKENKQTEHEVFEAIRTMVDGVLRTDTM